MDAFQFDQPYKQAESKMFFLIGIHSMQGWTAAMRHGVTRKRSTKKIAAYRKSVYKEPTVKRCLLILDVKPLRS